MAKAGFCSECNKNVYLNTRGGCNTGHGTECISNIYEVSEEQMARDRANAKASEKKVWGTLATIAIIVTMLIICSSSGNTQNNDEPTSSTVTDTQEEPSQSPPDLSISEPVNGSTVNTDQIDIAGTTDPNATVSINGTEYSVTSDGTFRSSINLSEGTNKILIIATDSDGHTSQKELIVTFSRPPPPTVQQTQPQPQPATSEIAVYVTRTGECYHRAGCQYLRQSCIPMSLSEAQQYYRA